MSNYGYGDDLGRAVVVVLLAGVLIVAAAAFFIGRCSTRYTVKVQVQPTQQQDAANKQGGSREQAE
jgi:hypothetical protein